MQTICKIIIVVIVLESQGKANKIVKPGIRCRECAGAVCIHYARVSNKFLYSGYFAHTFGPLTWLSADLLVPGAQHLERNKTKFWVTNECKWTIGSVVTKISHSR